MIVIPSDSEFRYHGELQMNPKDLAKSQSHMEKIIPFFKDKHVIVLRSDRGDSEELYREHTLQGIPIKSYTEIDEIDFSGNIHGMKYHFIRDKFDNAISEMFGRSYNHDFGYWGRMKDGCDRGKVLRKIYRDPDISTILIGGFPSGIKDNLRGSKIGISCIQNCLRVVLHFVSTGKTPRHYFKICRGTCDWYDSVCLSEL